MSHARSGAPAPSSSIRRMKGTRFANCDFSAPTKGPLKPDIKVGTVIYCDFKKRQMPRWFYFSLN